MTIKKNDKIELLIESVTSEGSGLGRYNGIAVFVRGTVPGDRIIAHIIKVSKNYAVGIIDEIIEPSPERIEPDCPVSQKCGGCSFRNMTYEEELRYKLSRVQDAITRIGHIDFSVERIIGADNTNHYRNKAQYPITIENGELTAGFYAYKSHRIIPCRDCRLQPPEFEQGIAAFGKWVKKNNVSSFDEESGKGLLRHIYFRKAFGTGEIMACAVINGNDIPDKDYLVSELRQAFDNLKSVVININKKNTNVILGEQTKTIWGNDKICDILLGKKFVISPQSFYQVNHDQCEKLYSIVGEYAELNGSETVVDLYCGAGTIGLTLADKCKELVGIEIEPSAIENAKENAKINGIENATFICADAFDGAKEMERRGLKPDLVIVDPPRKGCQKELFDIIENMGAGRIIYVSCDSATLARDLAILKEKNYNPQRITAVDMFPRTPHVETVVLLSKTQNIDVTKLTSKYSVRRLTEADTDIIYELCLSNPQLYEFSSHKLSKESLKEEALEAIPPGKSLADKYYVGFFEGEKLVAVLDLIDGYPEDEIAYIGFFMLAKEYQGSGLGSALVTEICNYLKSIGFRRARLGIDKENPQSNHFWKKNGFTVLTEVPQDDNHIFLRAERIL